MEQNNFNELEDQEQKDLPEEMEMNLFAKIDQTRSLGNIFGNFFEQIMGVITALLGGKKNP